MQIMGNGARGVARLSRAVLAAALVATCFGALASAAGAAEVEIVTQGEIPATAPKHVHYFSTIQAAVDATKHGAWVLIEPGVYAEEVKVTKPHSNIFIRGMDRNGVIVDGQSKSVPGGRNGIEVFKANKVWIENLTVRNFERENTEGAGGNEIWWNGGAESEKKRRARLVGTLPDRV